MESGISYSSIYHFCRSVKACRAESLRCVGVHRPGPQRPATDWGVSLPWPSSSECRGLPDTSSRKDLPLDWRKVMPLAEIVDDRPRLVRAGSDRVWRLGRLECYIVMRGQGHT
jgi:hypothetical protein